MDDNSIYAALTGLVVRPNDVKITGDIIGASMLDEEFTAINMMIKWYKYGFGRATDVCNERIRSGVLSRKEAINLVDKYDGICDDSIVLKYCNYVGINSSEFWSIVNNYANPNIFYIEKGKKPIKKFTVGIDFVD